MKSLLIKLTIASALLLGMMTAQQLPPLGGNEVYSTGKFLSGSHIVEISQTKGQLPTVKKQSEVLRTVAEHTK